MSTSSTPIGTVAAAVAVRGLGLTVSYVMIVKPPGADTRFIVANLSEFSFAERSRVLRRLGRELVRYPGRRRFFVGRAGMPCTRARACLRGLDIEVEPACPPPTLRVDTTHPAGVLSRPDTIVLPSRTVTVATDGSLNPTTGVAAAGLVTDTGVAGAEAFECRPGRIVEVEVRAILMGLQAFPTHDLRVLTDSRPALRIIRQASANRSRLMGIPGRLHAPLRTALAHYGGRLDVNWVAGHAGHPLNEAADRLVRAARREAEGSAPEGSARRVRANIRDELAA